MSDVLTESAGDERRLAEHLQRAGELLRGEKLDEAEREIECALRIRPQDLRARNLRGLFCFRAGRYEEALAVYLELCGAHPNDAALRLNLGLVELRIGTARRGGREPEARGRGRAGQHARAGLPRPGAHARG